MDRNKAIKLECETCKTRVILKNRPFVPSSYACTRCGFEIKPVWITITEDKHGLDDS